MKSDMVIYNGNIITVNEKTPRCRWVSVKNGKITGMGCDTDIPDADTYYDLQGNTMLPGLTDCHVHVLSAGLNLKSVPLENARHIDEVLQLIEDECKKTDEEWVYGANYVPQNISESRYPTRWELDNISHGKKVMIFAATLHGCATNTEGLKYCNVPENTPGVEKEGGEMTGVFSSDESSFLAICNALGALSDEKLWDYINVCAENAASKGVTSMHGLFGQFVDKDRDVHLTIHKKNELPIDMEIFYQTWDVEKALDLNLPRVGGCLTLDGALFEYTMANFKPFKSAPALRGVLYHNDEEVYNVVRKAHEAGIQCSMHAVGERAIDQLIYTYYRVIKEQGKKDLRHRIEHFCLPTDEQIDMAKDLDLIISMQPGFTYLWDKKVGGEFEYVLGRERADRWDPFNRIIDKGITVCGGSDCPVTKVEPLIDIATCVNGDNPIRNISLDDAIKMYTINAAYAVNMEDKKGNIEVGKDADFVVIDKDPYEIYNSQEIYNINVVKTIRRGETTYECGR